jgi:hypothetical protein
MQGIRWAKPANALSSLGISAHGPHLYAPVGDRRADVVGPAAGVALTSTTAQPPRM